MAVEDKKDKITEKGNKYLKGIGLEFSPDFIGPQVELNDPLKNEEDPDYESSTLNVGPFTHFLNP